MKNLEEKSNEIIFLKNQHVTDICMAVCLHLSPYKRSTSFHFNKRKYFSGINIPCNYSDNYQLLALSMSYF